MTTLREIEAAADLLPVSRKEELVRYLTARLQVDHRQPPRHADLAKFAGILRITEEPLAWQRKVREEWK